MFKQLLLAAAVASFPAAIKAATTSGTTLRLGSWNLRYDSQPNNLTVAHTIASLPDPLSPPSGGYYAGVASEKPWSQRRIGVKELVLRSGVDVIGFQEALVRQVHDLQELLGDGWGWVGVGRDDGKEAGEFSPVFYKKDKLRVAKWDTFWLTDTPFTPSKYPGAGSYRICTAVSFQAINSSLPPFTHLNTHLDDQSDAQRKLGGSLILYRASYEAQQTKKPVLVTGDFNSPQTGTDSSAYNVITGAIPPANISADFTKRFPLNSTATAFLMKDTKALTKRENVSGHYATFTGFTSPADAYSYTRIDFVFGGSNGGWSSESYRVENTLYDNGIWLSDHRLVVNEVNLLS